MTSYMVSIEPLVTAKMIDGAVTIAVAALADLTMRRRNSGSSSAPPIIIGLESFCLEQPHIGERLAGDIHFPFLPISWPWRTSYIFLTLVVIISLRWHHITQRDECQQHGNPLLHKWSETSFMDLKMMSVCVFGRIFGFGESGLGRLKASISNRTGFLDHRSGHSCQDP